MRTRPPSFRTERADFFFRIRSCECVGPRREKSLFLFSRASFLANVRNLSSPIPSFCLLLSSFLSLSPPTPTRHLERSEPTFSGGRTTPPSFRTERADFFFRIRSCECVGPRREKSLCIFVLANVRNLSSPISSFCLLVSNFPALSPPSSGR
jgi:hypothetical protein